MTELTMSGHERGDAGERRRYRIVALKHDGHIHRTFPDALRLLTLDHVWWSETATKVTEGSGRTWRTAAGAFHIFPPGEFFNIVLFNKPDGPEYYCNIASPAEVHDFEVRYIDYDLDIILGPGGLHTDDEEEYRRHADGMGYSVELQQTLAEAASALRFAAANRIGYFSPEYFAECRAALNIESTSGMMA